MDNRTPPNRLPEASGSSRKTVERAMILPLIGLLLLLPPIASIFEIDSRLFGIPFTLIYLFVIWAILIFTTFRLSVKLQGVEDKTPEIEGPPETEQGPAS